MHCMASSIWRKLGPNPCQLCKPLFRWYWDGPYQVAMTVLGWSAVPLFLLSVP